MTHPPHVQHAPTEPQPGARRSPAAWIVGGIALLAVLGVIAAVVLVIGRAGGDEDAPAAPKAAPASASAAPATISVRGSITLGLGDFNWDDGNGKNGFVTSATCAGRGGYDDIAVDASVTVTDASDTVVALGKLDGANPVGFSDAQTPTACKLSFTIPGVPAGKGFYGIEVSHRGAVKFEESKLAAPVELSLG